MQAFECPENNKIVSLVMDGYEIDNLHNVYHHSPELHNLCQKHYMLAILFDHVVRISRKGGYDPEQVPPQLDLVDLQFDNEDVYYDEDEY